MDFEQNLETEDKEIFDIIKKEEIRQLEQIELIASENYVSKAVMEAQGSVLTNKYAEGYPGKRYYHGCENVDEIETLAIERAKKLFNAGFANVQPHSGSQANTAVYLALLQPHDTILGMSLSAGGHLTHGAKVSISGKWLNAVSYGVKEDSGLIDYDEVEKLAIENKPKLIIAGGSAYPRQIDFARFRKIADKVGAYLMVDMAHFAGLVAAKLHPNPLEFADVVTTTTHKTLRGPRGGMILTNNEEIAKKINSAVFPGTQGGPLEHVIAAKAVCFKEDLNDSFKKYASNVIENAKVLGQTLEKRGLKLISGGTDTHLLLVDLRPKNLTGDVVASALEKAHITCNKNAIPFDPQPPKITSGIRLGTPAGTTRGFRKAEFEKIGNAIADVMDALVKGNEQEVIKNTAREMIALCHQFPIYEDFLS
ncbi:MAG TPA: serine hydroxymethyltransferase [Alphaproteobacteria bacterium]|nr:serine hydroxymethyltransferase [Alphaproteobacteria bacterium]